MIAMFRGREHGGGDGSGEVGGGGIRNFKGVRIIVAAAGAYDDRETIHVHAGESKGRKRGPGGGGSEDISGSAIFQALLLTVPEDSRSDKVSGAWEEVMERGGVGGEGSCRRYDFGVGESEAEVLIRRNLDVISSAGVGA